MPIRANDKEFEETSDSEDEEEEEKENDSTNGSDLGTWLEPDLKKGTLHFCNIPQIISEFFKLRTCLRTFSLHLHSECNFCIIEQLKIRFEQYFS